MRPAEARSAETDGSGWGFFRAIYRLPRVDVSGQEYCRTGSLHSLRSLLVDVNASLARQATEGTLNDDVFVSQLNDDINRHKQTCEIGRAHV